MGSDRALTVQARLEEALADGGDRYALADVMAQIDSGEAHLWAFERSAVVTKFIDEPAGRTFFYWLAGGDLDEIKRMEPRMSEWAKAHGCNRKMLAGRAGWQRALGWQRVGVVLAEVI